MNKLAQLSSSLLLLSLLFIYSGCKETEVNPNSSDISSNIDFELGEEISHSVVGLVLDENNNPVVGARVSLGTETAETNDVGVFEFFNVKTNENHA